MMRKTNLFGPAVILLLLALGSIPAVGAGSEPVCTTDGCTVPKSDPTDKCTPAYDDYARFIAGISNREGSPGGT